MSEKTYKNSDGEDRTIYQMVREEPDWTANVFRYMEEKIDKLKEDSKVLEGELRIIINAWQAKSNRQKQAYTKTRLDYLKLKASAPSQSADNLVIKLLKVARCPECDGGGTIVYTCDKYGEPDEIGPCQWCDERNRICEKEAT
jgi:hypothetical protein